MATTNRQNSNFTIPQDNLGGRSFYFAQGSSAQQFLDQGELFFN